MLTAVSGASAQMIFLSYFGYEPFLSTRIFSEVNYLSFLSRFVKQLISAIIIISSGPALLFVEYQAHKSTVRMTDEK